MKSRYLIIVLLGFVSCFPIEYASSDISFSEYQGLWYLKNMTDRPLRIETSDFYLTDEVESGDSVAVSYIFKYEPTFKDLYNVDSVGVYDHEGYELQKWIPDRWGHRKKDFFNESSWCHFTGKYGDRIIYYWVYELREENL